MKTYHLLLFAAIVAVSCQKTFIEPASTFTDANGVADTRNASGSAEWPGVFDPTQVLDLHLRMDKADWDIVRFDQTNSIEKPAWFKVEGEEEIQVAIRRKSSRALPSEANPWKVGLKMSITRFNAAQRWRGLTKLSLENGSDVGPVSEGVAWNLHQLASVDGFYGAETNPGLAAWVKLTITTHNADGSDPQTQYLGVYINVEQRDKQFMINRNLYTKGSSWLYEVDDVLQHALEVGDPHSPAYEALNYLPFRQVTITSGKKSSTIPTPSDPQLKSILDSRIDMQAMLTQGAIDAISSNNDALFSHGKNFKFTDLSTEGGKRKYYPWDLDAVFGKNDYGIYGTLGAKNKIVQSDYQRIILNHPYYREQYNAILNDLLGGPLSPVSVQGQLDAWKAAVQPALDADPYEAGLGHMGFDGLKVWYANRSLQVKSQMQKNLPAPRAKY